MVKQRIHKTARAIIARQGAVLLLQANGSQRMGLPGGHLNQAEQAIDALIREIREELAAECGLIRWLTTIECDWETALIHESMSLYEAQTIPLRAPLRAQESHLTAYWIPWYQVEACNLMPRQVYPWIARIAGSQPCG